MEIYYLWAYFQVKVLLPIVKLVQVVTIVVTSLIFSNHFHSKQANVYDGQTFDFIIIGGGSAGCVVANRLTEIPQWRVLLVEAGDDPPYASESPGISMLTTAALPDWNFYTLNDNYTSQAQKTGSIHLFRGKALGGSSTNNFMFYVRGNKADFNNWAALGNVGWDWNNVLNYFKKSEHLIDSDIMNSESAESHRTNGYLQLSRPSWISEVKEYLDAFKENGHDLITDMNDGYQLGYSVPLFSIGDSLRQSTAMSFIKPIIDRPNLFILKNTLAKKIIFDKDKKVVAVELNNSDNDIVVNVTNELILSAGAISSPQLLMLSGIGPKEHLSEKSIETIVDSPNVGKNLHDHTIVPVLLTDKKDLGSIYKNILPLLRTEHFICPLIMGHVSLNKSQSFPDYQSTVLPIPTGSLLPSVFSSLLFEWKDEICTSMANSTSQNIIFSLISLLHPKSRGRIYLKTNNIDDPPIIKNAYFTNKEDLNKLSESVEDFISVTKTTYFKSVGSEVVNLNIENCNDLIFGSHEYWKCYILNLGASQYHPAGTCAMGPGLGDVVDSSLKVRGTKGLRVVDASVMPSSISGNINAAVIMVAEKASDIIKLDNNIQD